MEPYILRLPTQILNRLADLLFNAEIDDDGDDHRQSLWCLALVDKRFNRIFTSWIYRKVSLQRAFDPEKTSPLESFVRSILASGERASMVQDFDVNPTAAEDLEQHQVKEINERLLELRPSHLGVSVWDECIKRNITPNSEVDAKYKYAHTGLLLALRLPNIRRLRLSGRVNHGIWLLLGEILDSLPHVDVVGYTMPPFWAKLEEVLVEGESPGRHMEEDQHSAKPVAIIASMPWVKKMYGASVADGYEGGDGLASHDEFRKIDPRSSDLETIVLQPECKLHHLNLDRLLRAPRALRTFKYNAGHARAHVTFKTSWLQHALGQQRDSLEEISLTHAFEVPNVGNPDDEMNPMSFSDFESLNTLEISLPFVFGYEALRFQQHNATRDYRAANPSTEELEASKNQLIDMLPRSINTLRFAQCGDEWAAKRLDIALLALFARREECVPGLKVIEVHAYSDLVGRGLPELRESFTEAERLGITAMACDGGWLGQDDVCDGWLNRMDAPDDPDLIDVVDEWE